MSKERDPHLGEIDDIEVDSHPTGRTAPGSRSRSSAQSGGEPPRRKPPRSASGNAGGQGPWVTLSLVLLALVLVMGVYFYREISTLQGKVEKTLTQSSQKLGNLESQLSATDESLSQSANTIEDRLQLHMDEIRKLWDVSNKRNKGWIQENQKNIKALQGSTGKLEKSLSQLDSQLGGLRQELRGATDARGRMQTRLDLVAETVQQLEDELNAQRSSLEELDGLRQQSKEINQRVGSTEEAIEAFDAWRRKVNNRLQALEQGGQGG